MFIPPGPESFSSGSLDAQQATVASHPFRPRSNDTLIQVPIKSAGRRLPNFLGKERVFDSVDSQRESCRPCPQGPALRKSELVAGCDLLRGTCNPCISSPR